MRTVIVALSGRDSVKNSGVRIGCGLISAIDQKRHPTSPRGSNSFSAIGALRTRLWLPSGWGYRGRRLSESLGLRQTHPAQQIGVARVGVHPVPEDVYT
jgi:hypothetical protein